MHLKTLLHQYTKQLVSKLSVARAVDLQSVPIFNMKFYNSKSTGYTQNQNIHGSDTNMFAPIEMLYYFLDICP